MKHRSSNRSPDMSKVYKVRSDEVEMVREALLKFVIEEKTVMRESDVIHALIRYKLKELTGKDLLRYREEVLGKDD